MSASPEDLFDRVAELTECYLLGAISSNQLVELETLVRDNAQAAQAMRTILRQAGTMHVVFSEQRQFASRIGETNHDEYLALLQTLQPTEEPELVHLVGSLDAKRPLWQQWPVVIPSAIAALLAIAVILIVTLPTGTPSTGTLDIAQVPDKPVAMTPSMPRGSYPVATLTAQHNATWEIPGAEGALAPGFALHPNQTLTLTAGFAEITTQRGAIAILEAPATIEILDNDNALRLHSGKIVGICETASSKGFLVRTPHMDITDLGTQFAVDVSSADSTQVHVIQGSVEVSAPTQDLQAQPPAQRLTSGHAASASSLYPKIQTVAYQPNRFDAIGPRVTTLPGTGVGLAENETDPNWRITAINGQQIQAPQTVGVHRLQPQFALQYPNDPATSQWVSWLPPVDQQRVVSTYVFTTQIDLPKSFNPLVDQLVCRLMADDFLTQIDVNGQPIQAPSRVRIDDPDAWHEEVYEIVIDRPLTAGRNTIAFTVQNNVSHPTLNYVGLRVAWELQTNNGLVAPSD